jgi:hypothetical protein
MLQGKKGRGSKSLHENSRRAKQIVRVGLRDEKLRVVRLLAHFTCGPDVSAGQEEPQAAAH